MNTRPNRRMGTKWTGVVIALSIVMAACGDNGDTSPEATEPPPTSEKSAESSDRLTPQPLPERESIVINSLVVETSAPLFLAEAMGEFEAENLDVEIVSLTFGDALTQMASGNMDACACGVVPASLNAVANGIRMKVVSSVFTSQPASIGLYVRPDLVDGLPASLEGTSLGLFAGWNSIFSLYLANWVEPAGLTLSDINAVTIPSFGDAFAALESGAIDGAYLIPPFTQQAVDSGSGVLIEEVVLPPGTPTVGVWFGTRLLDDEPEVGQAVLRALARTTREYLDEGYRENDETMAALADALGTTAEALRSASEPPGFSPDLAILDWGEETIELQSLWIELGGILDFDEPLPASEYIDTGPLSEAVG